MPAPYCSFNAARIVWALSGGSHCVKQIIIVFVKPTGRLVISRLIIGNISESFRC